ncbi:hypothetical protein [Trabulsiella odontotermitis]|uniref:hypothetical protein n=1 Tax=Trabulsiella odontotermitis TaxID=379893 RepID=UPI0006BA1314|nr:hypothetical protein [Trabulsiella odontotermitis]
MKEILTVVLLILSGSSVAKCWTVTDLKGVSYAQSNGYKQSDDAFNGKFVICIEPSYNSASVQYNGLDSGDVTYQPLRPNSVIGYGEGDNGAFTISQWTIQPDGTALFTKTIHGYGSSDSVKAMVGRVNTSY